MVFFNYSTMQMAAKVVYYGPGLCGKTTNLHYIYAHTTTDSRGEMVSLETETDRTLFFDLLPLDVGSIAGFNTRIQLYTVPGQVFYNTTRKLVLKGVDGVVFVVDSQRAMLQANLDSFRNLEENLAELGLATDNLPLVLQFNKRDLADIFPVEELNHAINRHSWPYYEASALAGQGVFETLKGISKYTLLALKKRLGRSGTEAASPGRIAPAGGVRPPLPAPAAAPHSRAPQPPPPAPPEIAASAAHLAAPAQAAPEPASPAVSSMGGNGASGEPGASPAAGPASALAGPAAPADAFSTSQLTGPAVAAAALGAAAGPAPAPPSLPAAAGAPAPSRPTAGAGAAAALAPPAGRQPAPARPGVMAPAAPAAGPTPAPAGVGKTTTGRLRSLDVLGELEKLRREAMQPAAVAAPAAASAPAGGLGTTITAGAMIAGKTAAGNGRAELSRSIEMTLKRADFQRARRFLVSFQVEDDQHRVVDAVRDLQVEIKDAASLEKLLLRLNIALHAKE